MSEKQIRVTIEDLKTGETMTREITDDYVLVCAGTAHISHASVHKNGTQQLTIKGCRKS